MRKNHIPVYGLDNFQLSGKKNTLVQVEVFDANRHFKVSYPHKHDFYEVLFLTQGSGIHIIDSSEYRIWPPCVFFMSPGQAHKLDLSIDISGYIFLFDADFYLVNQANKNRLLEFPFFFSVNQQNPPLILKEQVDITFLIQLFARGVQEMQQHNTIDSDMIRSLLDLILHTCNRLYPKDNGSIITTRGHILVKNLLLLIEENYQNNLRINDYAAMLAVTPNHLTQMVKEVTGKTSTQLLHEKLTIEIKRLLLYSDLSVTQIAEQLNFADQSYFTKFFKKECGYTPLQYRKKRRG